MITPHNPDNLSPLQCGESEGYRLLDSDEILTTAGMPWLNEIDQWWRTAYQWDTTRWIGGEPSMTFRTKLTRQQLHDARFPVCLCITEEQNTAIERLVKRYDELPTTLGYEILTNQTVIMAAFDFITIGIEGDGHAHS